MYSKWELADVLGYPRAGVVRKQGILIDLSPYEHALGTRLPYE
jgi:hypothetical protein